MSADGISKNDLLMRQNSGLGESAGLLDENHKSNSQQMNTTNSVNALHDCSMCWLTFGFVCFLVLTMLFRFKNPLQFYVKFGVYFVMTMAYSICAIPITLFRPNNARNIEYVGRQLSWLFKIFKVKITLENAKYLQINQPYILINNHQSSLDFLSTICLHLVAVCCFFLYTAILAVPKMRKTKKNKRKICGNISIHQI